MENFQNFITILFEGHSKLISDNVMLANCTCVLIKGKSTRIIVDTRTAWDGEHLKQALQKENTSPTDITHVVCTHSHSDHIGCNYLFLKAQQHIIGQTINYHEQYRFHKFNEAPFVIDEGIQVIATPGHTLDSVTLIVENSNLGNHVAICGDLFENSEDIQNPNIWIDAGSESIELQRKSRLMVAENADIIVPGHGPLFGITKDMLEKLKIEANLKS